MISVAGIYLKFYVRLGVGTYLPTPNPQPCLIKRHSLVELRVMCIISGVGEVNLSAMSSHPSLLQPVTEG